MRTALRWLGRGALALVLLLIVAIGVVYALSERELRKTYDVRLPDLEVPAELISVEEGERLARTRGCYNGCHGIEAEGEVFMDDFLFGSAKSPDLTRVARSLSDAEFARVVRHGVRKNGESVVIMPSPMFYSLTDVDIASILAFLRSLPPSDGPDTSLRLGPLARGLIAFGVFQTGAATIENEATRIDPANPSDPYAVGRYVAMTACSECHGPDLAGQSGPPFTTPNLAIVAAYTPEEFRRLMREGVPRDGRELDLMGIVSEKRFSHFTPDEVDALYAYLRDGL